jgi:transcriptional regulator with XRE-family HTH domain
VAEPAAAAVPEPRGRNLEDATVDSSDINDEVDPKEGATAQAREADLRLGRRIRALRLDRKISLAELAQRASVSVGALSQIERGLSSLKVRVLWPLAAALEVTPHSLLSDGEASASDLYCVRAAARRTVPVHSEGIRKELLSPPAATLTGLLVEVEPGGGSAGSYAHPGHEFGLVLEGAIDLTIETLVYRLQAGDSFAFKSTLAHAFHNGGSTRCRILWVNTAKLAEARHGV